MFHNDFISVFLLFSRLDDVDRTTTLKQCFFLTLLRLTYMELI